MKSSTRSGVVPRQKQTLRGSSWDAEELAAHPEWELNYLTAPPQMARYMDASTKIYQIYLKYVAPEDIHVYSIDEVFIDATPLSARPTGLTARELAMKHDSGRADTTPASPPPPGSARISICAKSPWTSAPSTCRRIANGVRIAELDEMSYRRHALDAPAADGFLAGGQRLSRESWKLRACIPWAISPAVRWAAPDDYYNEDLLYKLFGVNAELLIDHAWGWEPCTHGGHQGLPAPTPTASAPARCCQSPYPFDKARLVVREMADLLALDLVDKAHRDRSAHAGQSATMWKISPARKSAAVTAVRSSPTAMAAKSPGTRTARPRWSATPPPPAASFRL